jgi:hypothetical protein
MWPDGYDYQVHNSEIYYTLITNRLLIRKKKFTAKIETDLPSFRTNKKANRHAITNKANSDKIRQITIYYRALGSFNDDEMNTN